jgi:hypothetical protein
MIDLVAELYLSGRLDPAGRLDRTHGSQRILQSGDGPRMSWRMAETASLRYA